VLKETQYSFSTRFETDRHEREELIAAAHASCFSMACSDGSCGNSAGIHAGIHPHNGDHHDGQD